MLNLLRYRDGGEAGDRASTDALREYRRGIGAVVLQAHERGSRS